MNAAVLQPQLQQPYRRETWRDLLPQLLPGVELFAQPHDFPLTSERERTIAAARRQFGVATLADGKRVAFYEIEVAPSVQLLSNRVGLRSLIVKCIDEVSAHAVLAFFVQPGSRAYRLTYAAKESRLDEDLQVHTEQTAPRRYTYVLGPDESCRTAAERFAGLPAAAGIADLTDAFSVEKLSKDFFEDFRRAFGRVVADIKERNRGWLKELAEHEAQILLNRLIFLYFIQRKGWLNRRRDYLHAAFKEHDAKDPDGTSYYDKFLKNVFVKFSDNDAYFLDLGDLPFLNGGLFDDEQENLSPRYGMKIGNALFRHVFDDLLNAYNFTVREDTPLEQEVAIDPEMLGKIFEALVLQLEKGDDGTKSLRHDTGSRYTPRPIVHFLCREGLRAWLEQFPPDPARAADWPQRLEKLLALDASDGLDDSERAVLNDCLTAEEARALLDRLDDLRACDPAVGSGAFPVGLLHELVNLIRLCETRSRGKDPVETDSEWLYNTKSRIIQRVLYGVDIQERAIEICKLRLWLSLMVDCEIGVDVDDCSATAFRDALKKKVTPLPNLDFKIRRANSLIDMVRGHPIKFPREISDDNMLALIRSRLASAKTDFYNARNNKSKLRARFEILDANAELAVHEFSWAISALGFALDDKTAALAADLKHAEMEMGKLRALIKAALKRDPKKQKRELLRLSRVFDDVRHPTFVWQLDFADIFHRDVGRVTPQGENLLSTNADESPRQVTRPANSGFDLVLTNPPYVRIQVLNDTAPEQAAWFKQHYAAAGKGNYDLYVVFVERSLQLLQPRGQLAFILPHKFFNAQYGQPLRALLANGKHLRHVVHFGDQQIFPGATNYVCLLFLAKAGANACRWVRADNLPAWLASFAGPERSLPAKQITPAEWNFAVGSSAGLFEKLQRMPVKLGNAVDIFVGLQTSADDVFIMNFVSETARTITLESKSLKRHWTFEKELLHPVVSGTDVSAYGSLSRRQFILFPYQVEKEQAELISLKTISESWPRAAEYLKENKRRLENREGGKFKGTDWHRFGRNQNLGIQQRKKLCVPRLVEDLHAAPDFTGSHFLDNVDVGGLTFRESQSPHSLGYLLALLNSRLLRWFFPHVSAPFRGGWRSANKQFLSLVPFRPIDFEQASERAEHDALVGLAERILSAKRTNPSADTAALEREIDERVYRLYGLTAEEIEIVEGAEGAK